MKPLTMPDMMCSALNNTGEEPMTSSEKHCPHCASPCEAQSCGRTTDRSQKDKKDLLSRCNRVEGQIRGIKGMIEKDIYCDDILNQISAARSALDAMSRMLLENHLKSCVVSRVQAGELDVVDEVLTTIKRMMT